MPVQRHRQRTWKRKAAVIAAVATVCAATAVASPTALQKAEHVAAVVHKELRSLEKVVHLTNQEKTELLFNHMAKQRQRGQHSHRFVSLPKIQPVESCPDECKAAWKELEDIYDNGYLQCTATNSCGETEVKERIMKSEEVGGKCSRDLVCWGKLEEEVFKIGRTPAAAGEGHPAPGGEESSNAHSEGAQDAAEDGTQAGSTTATPADPSDATTSAPGEDGTGSAGDSTSEEYVPPTEDDTKPGELAGPGELGGPCVKKEDCAKGLVCSPVPAPKGDDANVHDAAVVASDLVREGATDDDVEQYRKKQAQKQGKRSKLGEQIEAETTKTIEKTSFDQLDSNKDEKEPVNPEDEPDEDEPKKKGFFGKIGSGLKNLGSKVAQGVKKVTNFVGDKVDSGLGQIDPNELHVAKKNLKAIIAKHSDDAEKQTSVHSDDANAFLNDVQQDDEARSGSYSVFLQLKATTNAFLFDGARRSGGRTKGGKKKKEQAPADVAVEDEANAFLNEVRQQDASEEVVMICIKPDQLDVVDALDGLSGTEVKVAKDVGTKADEEDAKKDGKMTKAGKAAMKASAQKAKREARAAAKEAKKEAKAGKVQEEKDKKQAKKDAKAGHATAKKDEQREKKESKQKLKAGKQSEEEEKKEAKKAAKAGKGQEEKDKKDAKKAAKAGKAQEEKDKKEAKKAEKAGKRGEEEEKKSAAAGGGRRRRAGSTAA